MLEVSVVSATSEPKLSTGVYLVTCFATPFTGVANLATRYSVSQTLLKETRCKPRSLVKDFKLP